MSCQKVKLLFCSVCFILFLDSSNKRNHMVFVLTQEQQIHRQWIYCVLEQCAVLCCVLKPTQDCINNITNPPAKLSHLKNTGVVCTSTSQCWRGISEPPRPHPPPTTHVFMRSLGAYWNWVQCSRTKGSHLHLLWPDSCSNKTFFWRGRYIPYTELSNFLF